MSSNRFMKSMLAMLVASVAFGEGFRPLPEPVIEGGEKWKPGSKSLRVRVEWKATKGKEDNPVEVGKTSISITRRCQTGTEEEIREAFRKQVQELIKGPVLAKMKEAGLEGELNDLWTFNDDEKKGARIYVGAAKNSVLDPAQLRGAEEDNYVDGCFPNDDGTTSRKVISVGDGEKAPAERLVRSASQTLSFTFANVGTSFEVLDKTADMLRELNKENKATNALKVDVLGANYSESLSEATQKKLLEELGPAANAEALARYYEDSTERDYIGGRVFREPLRVSSANPNLIRQLIKIEETKDGGFVGKAKVPFSQQYAGLKWPSKNGGKWGVDRGVVSAEVDGEITDENKLSTLVTVNYSKSCLNEGREKAKTYIQQIANDDRIFIEEFVPEVGTATDYRDFDQPSATEQNNVWKKLFTYSNEAKYKDNKELFGKSKWENQCTKEVRVSEKAPSEDGDRYFTASYELSFGSSNLNQVKKLEKDVKARRDEMNGRSQKLDSDYSLSLTRQDFAEIDALDPLAYRIRPQARRALGEKLKCLEGDYKSICLIGTETQMGSGAIALEAAMLGADANMNESVARTASLKSAPAPVTASARGVISFYVTAVYYQYATMVVHDIEDVEVPKDLN